MFRNRKGSFASVPTETGASQTGHRMGKETAPMFLVWRYLQTNPQTFGNNLFRWLTHRLRVGVTEAALRDCAIRAGAQIMPALAARSSVLRRLPFASARRDGDVEELHRAPRPIWASFRATALIRSCARLVRRAFRHRRLSAASKISSLRRNAVPREAFQPQSNPEKRR